MPASTDLPTYRDILDYLIDYQRGNPSPYVQRNARRAIVEAVRVLTNAHQWPYFTQVGRVNTVAPYSEGTVVYDHTGGAYERLLTLTDGSWPDWAPYGTVVINNIQYGVAERRSATELQLEIYQNPGYDILDPTSYSIYRDTYTLPGDCISIDEIFNCGSYTRVQYVHPRDWLYSHRYHDSSSNSPTMYTVTGDPDFQGQMAVRFFPYPDSVLAMDFIYQRRPRSNNVEGVYAGTLSVTEGNAVLYGTDTNWDDTLVGSLIRLSSDGVELPTGLDGGNPYRLERMVMDVTTPTQLTIDQPSPWTLSNIKYLISDPIDIDPGAMQTAFLRCCEAQLGRIARFQDADKLEMVYQLELERAKVASRVSTAPRAMGSGTIYGQRMANMPMGPDDE